MASAAAGYLGAIECKRRSRGISPGVIYGISAGTTFGAANVAYCLALGTSFEPSFVIYGDERFLFEAACIGLIGTVSPLVAYAWSEPRLSRLKWRVGSRTSSIGTRRFAWVLLVASALARLVPSIPAAMGSLGIVLDLGPSLAIFILRFEYFSSSGRRSRSLLLLVLTVAEVGYALAFRFLRTEMIWPLLAYVLPLFFARGHKRISRLSRSFLAVSAVAGFVLVFGQFGENRDKYEGSDRISVVLLGSKEASGPDIKGAPGVEVVARLSTMNQLSALEGVVARRGTFGGSTLKPLLYAPIPRLVWPTKPQIVPGQQYARLLGRGSELPGGRFSNAINSTLPGDFRLNFGWAASVAGSAVFGLMLALGWSLCRHFVDGRDPAATVGAFLLITAAAFVGANAAALFAVASSIIVALLLGWLISLGRTGRRPRFSQPLGWASPVPAGPT